MSWDLEERAWWVFRMSPTAVAYVAAETEQKARSVHARETYPGAPVDSWPLIATRFTSRQALAASLTTSVTNQGESK